MRRITASVGRNGINEPTDVRTVQQLCKSLGWLSYHFSRRR